MFYLYLYMPLKKWVAWGSEHHVVDVCLCMGCVWEYGVYAWDGLEPKKKHAFEEMRGVGVSKHSGGRYQ